MKKILKARTTANVSADVSNDPLIVHRKSKTMSLNHDVSEQGAPAVGTVELTTLSWGEIIELRKKLERSLEEVRAVASKIDSRLDVLYEERKVRIIAGISESRDRDTRSSGAKSWRADQDNRQERKAFASNKSASAPPSASGGTPRSKQREMMSFHWEADRFARPPSGLAPEAATGTLREKTKRTRTANPVYQNDFVSGEDILDPRPEKPKPKKVITGRGENKDPRGQEIEAASSMRMAISLKQCTTLLRKLMSQKYAYVFNAPVDVKSQLLYDYHRVIEKPMDLGTIKKKLKSKDYPSPAEFACDVRLTFSNAMTYNPKNHDVYVLAETYNKMFEDSWKDMIQNIEDEKKLADREEKMLVNNYEEDVVVDDLSLVDALDKAPVMEEDVVVDDLSLVDALNKAPVKEEDVVVDDLSPVDVLDKARVKEEDVVVDDLSPVDVPDKAPDKDIKSSGSGSDNSASGSSESGSGSGTSSGSSSRGSSESESDAEGGRTSGTAPQASPDN